MVSEGDVTVGGAEDNQAYVPETSDDQVDKSFGILSWIVERLPDYVYKFSGCDARYLCYH